MDTVRIEEQKKFYEIARQRAAELDVYMEQFRRDIVESSKLKSPGFCMCISLTGVTLVIDGLTKLFAEFREKPTIEDLSPQYQKFAEWLRIEYVTSSSSLFPPTYIEQNRCNNIPFVPCRRQLP